jgi:hypothetical protein
MGSIPQMTEIPHLILESGGFSHPQRDNALRVTSPRIPSAEAFATMRGSPRGLISYSNGPPMIADNHCVATRAKYTAKAADRTQGLVGRMDPECNRFPSVLFPGVGTVEAYHTRRPM